MSTPVLESPAPEIAPALEAAPGSPPSGGDEGGAPLVRSLRICSALVSVAAIVTASLALVGWGTGQAALERFLVSHTAPNPVTSSGVLLAGVALLGLRVGRPRAEAVARWLGLALVVLGVAIALGMVGVLPALDQAAERLFSRRGRVDVIPGMSPISATALVLTGMGILFLSDRGRQHAAIGQLLGLAVFLVALLAVVGHLYGAHEIYTIPGRHAMSFPSALGFGLVGTGMLLARPGAGLMRRLSGDTPGAHMARSLIPWCLVLPTMIGSALFLASGSGTLNRPVALALSVLATTLVLLALVWYQARHTDLVEEHRRAAIAQRNRSELFFHTLVETLPQNYLIKDAEGRFLFGNRRFCETVGRHPRDVEGKTDFDLFPHALAEKYRTDDRRVMDGRETVDMVEEHVTPDGRTHYVHVIKAPLLDATGALVGVQGIFWDVTAERLAERRLLEQYEQLEQLAASERRALEELKRAQAQMVQTEKLAGLGQMVAGVAHEINNPLSFVINNLVVLQRDLTEVLAVLAAYREADPLIESADCDRAATIAALRDGADLDYSLGNMPHMIERTREGLARIQRIVRDLRVFARVDEDRYAETDLNEGIASTVRIIQGTARAREVAIDLELEPMPPVTCQASKLHQVVMNLVSNAVEACPPGGGKVWIRSRHVEPMVIIEVEDNGCGIEPDVIERIFDPFFTTKPVGEGTGLGLAISYGILQEHRGQIDVESRPGRGTRFTIRLPRHHEPRATAAGAAPEPGRAAQNASEESPP